MDRTSPIGVKAASLGLLAQPAPTSPFNNIGMTANELAATTERVEEVARRLVGSWPESPEAVGQPPSQMAPPAVDRLTEADNRINGYIARINRAVAQVERVLP